jgi:hypothetical protein
VPARVIPSTGGVTSSSEAPLVEEEAPFQNIYKSWKVQKYGREPKQRLTVLARPSSNLMDGAGLPLSPRSVRVEGGSWVDSEKSMRLV